MSNKTPKSNIAATASEPRTPRAKSLRRPLLLLIGITYYAVFFGILWLNARTDKVHINEPCLRYSVIQEKNANDCLVSLEIVQDENLVEKGLGGRASMPLSHGMLFVFPEEGEHCFWMKDMKFHLDIVWFNANKEIVHIVSDVAPETYPKPFCPSVPAQYVLEINAGEAQNLQLKAGQKLQF